jgi:hypothetical protein
MTRKGFVDGLIVRGADDHASELAASGEDRRTRIVRVPRDAADRSEAERDILGTGPGRLRACRRCRDHEDRRAGAYVS